MRAIANWIDRFCREHPRFGIPNLMMYLALANVAVCLIDNFSTGGATLSSLLYFSRAAILKGQVWRLVTFILVPASQNLLLGAITAYFYFWVGSTLERQWGTGRFTIFYLSGVALNILFGLVAGYASMYYINLSLFFAFAVLYPDLRVLLFFIIPIKVKWLAWVDAALFLWESITYLMAGQIGSALLPVVAILNFLVFFWEDFTEAFGIRRARVRHQTSRQTIDFKKAVSKAYEEKGYIHKCAVCGRTDSDFPDLEFRYCSKCNGDYCYCIDHIYDHEHIQ